MTEITVEYLGDLQCRVHHGPSGASMLTDAPPDNNGLGRQFAPTDLVGTALGSCILTVMGIVARKHGIDMSGARLSVRKHMSAQPPRRIARLEVDIVMPRPLGEEDVRRLENAAHLCPVHRSLHPDIVVPISFRWPSS